MHIRTAEQIEVERFRDRSSEFLRQLVIGVIGFLTLVDLFAAQALLPVLARSYQVSAASMGLAVNAGTIGMAVSSLAVALLSARIDRWRGIWLSLALLAVPTLLLAWAPNILVFAILRIMQGLCMASAFTLTAAYLGEHLSPDATARALAAYVTGIVASNLFGRLAATTTTGLLGLEANFVLFAALNLAGAVLAYTNFERMNRLAAMARMRSSMEGWRAHLNDPRLRAAFAIGFLILFVFIGIFTYVNFVLVLPPFSVGQMSLGLVYLVFFPSMFTTPMAGRLASRYGGRTVCVASLLLAIVGLPQLLVPELPFVLTGMVLVGIGTFAAQAAVTGYVGRTATIDRGAASGLYLASYYAGGLTGAATLGQVYQRGGWHWTVLMVAVALVLAVIMARRLE